MFFAPQMRVPPTWGLMAFLLGAFVLYIPLAKTSRLERSGDLVLMRRSQGFILILLGLLALRIALHEWVGQYLSPTQTAALFFLLAFGMIVRWRLAMLRSYRALTS
jgi:membrane protein CcdC involved in cytochrome C biogenesis